MLRKRERITKIGVEKMGTSHYVFLPIPAYSNSPHEKYIVFYEFYCKMYHLFLVENIDNSIPFLIFIDNFMLKIIRHIFSIKNPAYSCFIPS